MFTMHHAPQIDWLAVFIAAIVNMAISYFWYSKWLFGPIWYKLSKTKEGKMDLMPVLGTFIASLVTAYFLAFFAIHMGITTVGDGMLMGAGAWLGFVATTQVATYLWSSHKPWMLFVIKTGHKLVSFIVMAGILGA